MRIFLSLFLGFLIGISCQGKQPTSEQKAIHKTDSSKTESVVPVLSRLEQRLLKMGMICIDERGSTIRVEMKYATTDNFTKKVLYDSLSKAYLHPIAAEKLLKAQKLLKAINQNYTFIVYDAARPLSVQKKMYEVVKNTKYSAYVAHPSRHSLHNYGIAVDLTICRLDGKCLDMGTPFDFFGQKASIRNESAHLTKQQLENRKLLRRVMTQAGFLTIQGEWWHFNALSLQEAKAKCKLLE